MLMGWPPHSTSHKPAKTRFVGARPHPTCSARGTPRRRCWKCRPGSQCRNLGHALEAGQGASAIVARHGVGSSCEDLAALVAVRCAAGYICTEHDIA
eukprot:scaffold651360_cov52-Prasinocladus_malaysianus.AAC.1